MRKSEIMEVPIRIKINSTNKHKEDFKCLSLKENLKLKCLYYLKIRLMQTIINKNHNKIVF